MKAKIALSLLLSFYFCLLSSQVPQGFNYQAIVRDGSGNPITGATIKVMLSVMSDTTGFYASGTGTYIWEEEQTNIKTNAFGLFSITFGDPSAVKVQGSAANFSSIPWSVNPLFIGTKIANPTNYKIMGSAKLWSVPYSLVSGALSGSLTKLAVTGTTTLLDEPLFEVKNNTGQTVFAVYNEGIRAYVDDGVAKGATKGGFAIGGFGSAKAPSQEYLRVTRDSTRVYVNDNAKSSKGGFAIGGFAGAKGDINKYLNLTKENIFIGNQSGVNNLGYDNVFLGNLSGTDNSGGQNVFLGNQVGQLNTGNANVFIGDRSGKSNTSGSTNVFIGESSGYQNLSGWGNVFVGNYTGNSNTSGGSNIFIGNESGYYNTQGSNNTFLGIHAGQSNTTGTNNIFLGESAGFSNQSTNGNVFFGQYAGYNHTTGWQNTFIGHMVGNHNNSGSNNLFLGSYAGNNNLTGDISVLLGAYAGENDTTGTNNVFLGPHAGRNAKGSYNVFIGFTAGYSETESNKLYVANSATASPLIWGDFQTQTVVINGNSALNSLNTNFFVNGTAGGKFPWLSPSDARLKKNILTIPDALQKVLTLRGVNFEWISPTGYEKGLRMGFVAQEAERVIPEVVVNQNGNYSMEYGPISALLVEAIKEQQKIIDTQRNKIDMQEKELQSLKNRVEVIEALFAKSGVR